MPFAKKCCVPGCFEAGASHPALHFFPNPEKYPERFRVWITSVGGDLLQLSTEYVYKYRRVCHAHFEEKFCCRYDRLSNIAIPTLNLPENLPVPGSDFPSGSMKRPLLSSIENIMEVLPSTSKVPGSDLPSGSSGKRPLSSIENVMEILPSTSKVPGSEFPSGSMKRPLSSIENVMEILPSISKGSKSKKVKTVFKTRVENLLSKKLIAAKIKISKCKNKIKKQAAAIKAAKNFVTHTGTLKALESMTRSARVITMLQFRETKKKSQGRRFTYDEKMVALSLLKRSPKGYRLLRRMFTLPAPQTLNKLITMANLQPGINSNIFMQLKKKAKKMKPFEKLCVLLFDEMALKSNVTYNERMDKIVGFVDNGEKTSAEFADHAQVFMVRGLIKNYKHPIGYTLSASATKGPELARQIKLFIKELLKAGLTVVATVCDQGSGNRNAIKCLTEESRATWLKNGQEPKNNIILIGNEEIVPLYDTPHLIKCVRNNLMTKDIKYTKNNETKIAKWSHIQKLYETNPAYKGIRLIPKLTENHVNPAKISKMKVKYATQLFSQTVAVNMGYLADNGLIPKECNETADILLFFDKLFDSLNGSSKKKYLHSKPALGPVTPNSVHHKIWIEAKNMLRNMKFINNGKIESIPTLTNWAWTLDGMETLCNILEKKHGVYSIWMRHLNQDPLENFFGSVRSHGCRNNNPTPERFQSVFATLLINNAASVHAPGNNCEDDAAESLQSLVINEDCKANNNNPEVNFDTEIFSKINITPLEDKISNPIKKAGLEYCSGYFAKKCKEKVFRNCIQCKTNFINDVEATYIRYREFQGKRWLCSPTKELIINISNMQDIIYSILINNIESNSIKELIKTIILIYLDFNYIECNRHKDSLINYLINLVSRMFIYNYCKNINQILCGKRNIEDDGDLIQVKAKKYYDKCYKKKK